MGFLQKTYYLRYGLQRCEYHNARRVPKGYGKRKKLTPEQILKHNQKAKERKTQRLLLNNFGDDDLYITLTYGKGQEPKTIEEVYRDLRNLVGLLKRLNTKAGTVLKWIKNIERTKRGIFHIHMVINHIPGIDLKKIIRKYWKERHGKIVDVRETYLDGGFEQLARYLSKTDREEDGKQISSVSSSRTVTDVEPKVKEYQRWSVMDHGDWKEIKVPKGYELVKDSVWTGFDPVGYPVRHYTMIKVREDDDDDH